jgi:hypothetical protein
VELLALVPLLRLPTGKFPVTPVVNGSPVKLLAVPLAGVPSAPPAYRMVELELGKVYVLVEVAGPETAKKVLPIAFPVVSEYEANSPEVEVEPPETSPPAPPAISDVNVPGVPPAGTMRIDASDFMYHLPISHTPPIQAA